jgi:hypothetical protein
VYFTFFKLACALVKVDDLKYFMCTLLLFVCAALRCSRMRVQDVLQKELPFLLSKEFSTIKKDDQFSAAEYPVSIIACTHQEKWTALFDQMDEALNAEMNHLVSSI